MVSVLKKMFRKSALARLLYAQAEFLLLSIADTPFRIGRILLFFKVMPYTMVGYKCVRNVHDLASEAVQKGIPGAFVECGVWKGGVAGVMAHIAEKENKGRTTWLFDSFEGLPEPTNKDGKDAFEYSGNKSSGKLVSIEKCVGPLKDVQRLLFSVLKLKEDHIRIVKGWFQDTLPQEKGNIGEIAVLRLDADWYESTKCALENLYDLVASRGYIIIDDYGHWEGCRKALEEFLKSRNLSVALRPIDSFSVYFQKP